MDDIKLTKKDRLEGYKPQYYFKSNEENFDENILSKITQEVMKNYDKYTSTSVKQFTLDDMYKAIEQLEKLPPVPVEIEIGKIAWDILVSKLNVHMIHDKSKISTLFGVRIVFCEDDEIKFNQMKVKYNNGNSKVIDVFEWNCNYDVIYKNIFEEEE